MPVRPVPPLLPEPRTARPQGGRLVLRQDTPIVLLGADDDRDLASASFLRDAIERESGLRLPIESHAVPLPAAMRAIVLSRGAGEREGYALRVGDGGAQLRGDGVPGLRWAAATLAQLVRGRSLPGCEIEDAPDFPRRGIMLDVSRGKVPSEATLRGLVDLCAALKLNVLMLYVEHTFRFRRHPGIGAGDSPLEPELLRRLDQYAAASCVELVPSLQSLGHMEHVLKLPEYRRLAETDLGWTITPADPDTYALLADLYAEYLPNFRSRLFNANCDEPWDLERGRSAARAAELGPGGVYLEHVRRVRDLAGAHGRRTLIWGDVVHAHPQRIPEIDRDLVLLDWWYEAGLSDFDRVRAFAEAGLEFWVCPGTSTWNSLFPRVANACENIARWADAGRRHGASGLLVTDWGDFGHYNLQGNSWHAYAWGAQQAWSGDGDPRRVDRAAARVLFGDDSGASARLYRELGAVHDPGFSVFNGSPLQYLFFDELEEAVFVGATTAPALRRCRRQLERTRVRIAAARAAFERDEQTWEELRYAADASAWAVAKAELGREYLAWRRAPERLRAPARRALARRLRALADEQSALWRRFRRLWLARSRVSNLGQTRRRFQHSLRSLRAAAARLERSRPAPPPRRSALAPADVLRAVRRSLGRGGANVA